MVAAHYNISIVSMRNGFNRLPYLQIMAILRAFSLKTLAFAFALLMACEAKAESSDLSQMLAKLDSAISMSAHFVAERKGRIARLESKLKTAKTLKGQYSLHYELYGECRSYSNPDALRQLSSCIAIASRMGDGKAKARCQLLLVSQLANSGFYFEASRVFGAVDRGTLDAESRALFYAVANSFYGELARYTATEGMADGYYGLAAQYRDSLYKALSPSDPLALRKRQDQLLADKKVGEALAVSDKWINSVKPYSHDYAIAAYGRYQVYQALGDRDKMKYWLAVSAVSDVRNAVMDQASLWTLADELSREGEIERPYRYITFAWNASQMFKARLRSWQITPVLTSVEHNSQMQKTVANRRLKVLVAGIGLLVALLAISLWVVNRQRRCLSDMRDDLKVANDKLKRVNRQLTMANVGLDSNNRQLSEANKSLVVANAKLNESSRMKEEYIGRFFETSAHYINEMDVLRKKALRMLSHKEYSELGKMLSASGLDNSGLAEFYSNFDQAFLHLFPHFVEDFNMLIAENERIKPKSDGRLNTVLRVFALIRLGIDSSARIAELLNCSASTVYNYRTQMKNAALVERSDFEKCVKELGLPEGIKH